MAKKKLFAPKMPSPKPAWIVEKHAFPDGSVHLAHRHPNGGGWVSEDSKVSPHVFLDKDVQVYGYSKIYGKCRISGHATIHNSHLSGTYAAGLRIDSNYAEIKNCKILANTGSIRIAAAYASLVNCRIVCKTSKDKLTIYGYFFAQDAYITPTLVYSNGHVVLYGVHLDSGVDLTGMIQLVDCYLKDAAIENRMDIRDCAATGNIEFGLNFSLDVVDYVGRTIPNGHLTRILAPTQLRDFKVHRGMGNVDGELKDLDSAGEVENLTKEVAKLNELLEESDRLNDELQTKLLDFHLQSP